MRPTGPNFGTAHFDYRLGSVFFKACNEFHQADQELGELSESYEETTSPDLIKPMFDASQRRREAGVVCLMTGVAWLEQVLYAYAVHHIHPNSYNEHFDNLRPITRWLLVPRICTGQLIKEDDPAIQKLRELLHARNAVIHPKIQIMHDPGVSHDRITKEEARFLSACRTLEQTVLDLKALLK